MHRVGEQRQRVGGDPRDRLHHREPEDERERDPERATVAVQPLLVRVCVHHRNLARTSDREHGEGSDGGRE